HRAGRARPRKGPPGAAGGGGGARMRHPVQARTIVPHATTPDTPGRRARRAWNRGPALEREIVTLGETLAILEANLAAHIDKGNTARAIETQAANDNCVARFERAQDELAILRGKAS